MLHRMNLGAIVSDVMMKVKFFGGGYIGMIEEFYFPFEQRRCFYFSRKSFRNCEYQRTGSSGKIKLKKRGIAASYAGGRLSMTSLFVSFFKRKIG